MNSLERRALRRLHLDIMKVMDPRYIMDYLYRNDVIDIPDIETIESKVPRHDRCRYLLLTIPDRCSMKTFIQALEHNDSYTFLARKIKAKIIELKIGKITKKRNQVDRANQNNASVCDRIVKAVPKIATNDKMDRALRNLTYHLNFLSMEGKPEEQETYLNKNVNRWQENYDIKFIYLEAKGDRTIVHTKNVGRMNTLLKEMTEIIPYTRNPTAASIVYLSLKAQSFSLQGDIDNGMKCLENARMIATDLVPGRDTGICLYVEILLLLKTYSSTPSEDLKSEILKRMPVAVDHMRHDQDEVIGEDNARRVLVRKAMVHLGIGLNGNILRNTNVTDKDMMETNTCLFAINAMKAKVDNRRNMFIKMCWATYNMHMNKSEAALENLDLAKKYATKGNYHEILSNLEKFQIETKFKPDEIDDSLRVLNVINETV